LENGLILGFSELNRTPATRFPTIILYIYLQEYYSADFSNLNMLHSGHTMRAGDILPIIMADFIDFDNRTSNLYHPSFVRILDDIGRVCNETDYWGVYYRPGTPTSEYFDWASTEYAFVSLIRTFSPLVVMFDLLDTGFSHFIPITNSDGSLLINPSPMNGGGTTWAMLCIPKVGNGELAWEFIHHLAYSFINPVNPDGSAQSNIVTSLATPIINTHFRDHITTVVDRLSTPRFRDSLSLFPVLYKRELCDYSLENALNTLDALGRMPAQVMETDLLWLLHNNSSAIEQFVLGTATSQETAQALHNMVSLWLMG